MMETAGQYLGLGLVFYFLFGLGLVTPILALAFLMCFKRLYCIRSDADQGRSFGSFRVTAELIFGFLNPLLYILLLFPTLWGPDEPGQSFVLSTGLLVLSLFWAARTFTDSLWLRFGKSLRVLSRVLATVALLTIVAHFSIGIRYVAYHWFTSGKISLVSVPVLLALFVCGLHYLPAMAMTAYFASQESRRCQTERQKRFILRPRARAFALISLGIIACISLVSPLSQSPEAGKAFVEKNREEIIIAAQSSFLQPADLAAVLAAAIDDTALWKPLFEGALMQAWLVDSTSHYFLSRSLDFSIGPGQIKPTTLQTALMIKARCDRKEDSNKDFYPTFSKEYRDAWRPDGTWRLDNTACVLIGSPLGGTPNKATIVTMLLDDKAAIRAAALILALHAAQWQQAGFTIRKDLGILASLYQIGFRKSQPHANPQANAFGWRAVRLKDELDLKTLFPNELSAPEKPMAVVPPPTPLPTPLAQDENYEPCLGGQLTNREFDQPPMNRLCNPLNQEDLLVYECPLNGKTLGLFLFDREDNEDTVPWLILFEGRQEVARHKLQDNFYFTGGTFTASCKDSTIVLETKPGGRTCLHLVSTFSFKNGKLHLKQRRAEACDGAKG